MGPHAETTATPTKTGLKNSCFLNKFAMISTHLVCVMWPNCPGVNFMGVAFKFRTREEN